MKSIKKLIVMCAAGSLALLTAACGGGAADAEQQVPTVNVATLHAVSDAAKLQYPGRVKAAEEINLAFKVSGRIERILVKEGDYVKAGQLVAIIDPSDYETQLQAIRAEHAQVTAESDRDLEKKEKPTSSGVVTCLMSALLQLWDCVMR